MSMADQFVLLDHVTFEKGSFINRNRIKGVNGEYWITIPLKQKGLMDTPINEVMVSHEENWRAKHIKSITQDYSRAPFFDEELTDTYIKSDRLLPYCLATTEYLMDKFGVSVKVVFSSELDCKKAKSELILEICLKMEAERYISGPLGRDYLDLDAFTKNEIQVTFHDHQQDEYPQRYGDYIPNLSAIDLLYNCGGMGG